jgi:hypothetical protein
MANKDLFKEAIADAKAIRETAIANAKAALEESFTPAIKDMLRAKLEEMESEEYEEDDTMMEMEDDQLEEVETIDEETIDEEEIDLDELVASVQESDDEVLNEQEEEEEIESEEEVEMEDEPEEGEEEMEADEDEEIDLENLTVEELEDLIKDVIEDMMEAGEIEMESDEEESLEDVEDMEGEEDEEDEVEVELEEILNELKSYYEEDDEGMEEGKKEEIEEYAGIGMDVSQIEGILALLAGTVGLPVAVLASSYAKEGMAGLKRLLAKAGKKMEEELNEAISTINQLRSDLNEVNLLNSKLLYTNKIFKDKNLSEETKLKVVEAFDKATTAKEAKVVYETLKESIATKPASRQIKESLGFASKPMGTSTAKQPIVEAFDFKTRWQRLAGINTEN